jgi:hypothetical protein
MEEQQVAIPRAPPRGQHLRLLLLGPVKYSAPRHNGFALIRGYMPTSLVAQGNFAGGAVMAHHVARVTRGRMIRVLWAAFLCLLLVLPTCTYPGEERTSRAGLAVSRAALQAFFARPEFGFIFGEPHESRGVPSLTGTVPGKLMALVLVGPPENLTEVTLMVGVPSTTPLEPPSDAKTVAENTRYLRAVLQRAMPDWQEGVAWLTTQLQRQSERHQVGLRKGHREVVLLAVNHWNMGLLSIRAGSLASKRER